MAVNHKKGIVPVIRNYYIQSEKIDREVKFVHLSDLHGCIYGSHQRVLLQMILRLSPDAVLMTGDMLEKRFSKAPVGELFCGLAKHFPCYGVMGNHEFYYDNYKGAAKYYRACGIQLLEGRHTELRICGRRFNICGVSDPKNPAEGFLLQMESAFSDIDTDLYTILLSHRPECADLYRQYPCDLVLSGHAHGGQWIVPKLINGVYAPNQGIFPKYAGGRYDFEGQTQIVSRGLAYHVRVPRIGNPVEVGVINIVPCFKFSSSTRA